MIEFNGTTYYFDRSTGYYRSHMRRGDREYLHRAVYRSEYGNIPHGWHVHHKDEDTSNNDITNLEAVPPLEHNQLHAETLRENGRSTRNLVTPMASFVCEGCGVGYTAHRGRRNRWCSKKCANAYWNAQCRS